MQRCAVVVAVGLGLLSVVAAVSLRTATGTASAFEEGSCERSCRDLMRDFQASDPNKFFRNMCEKSLDYVIEAVSEDADGLPEACVEALENGDESARNEISECHNNIKAACNGREPETSAAASLGYESGACEKSCKATMNKFHSESPSRFYTNMCATEEGIISASTFLDVMKEEGDDYLADGCVDALDNDDSDVQAEIDECHAWIKKTCEKDATKTEDTCIAECKDILKGMIAEQGDSSEKLAAMRNHICELSDDDFLSTFLSESSNVFSDYEDAEDDEKGHLAKMCENNSEASTQCKAQLCTVELQAEGCADACFDRYKDLAYEDHTGDEMRRIHHHICKENFEVDDKLAKSQWEESEKMTVMYCSQESGEKVASAVRECNQKLREEFCEGSITKKVKQLKKTHEELNGCVPTCIRALEKFYERDPGGFRDDRICRTDDYARTLYEQRDSVWGERSECREEWSNSEQCAVRLEELCTGREAWDESKCVSQCEDFWKRKEEEETAAFYIGICQKMKTDQTFLTPYVSKMWDSKCMGGTASAITERLGECVKRTEGICDDSSNDCVNTCKEWVELSKKQYPNEFAEELCPDEDSDKRAQLVESVSKYWDGTRMGKCTPRKEEAIDKCLAHLKALCA